MRKIVVFENITLDGVMQDPIGAESVDAVDWRDSLSTAANEEWIQRIVNDTPGRCPPRGTARPAPGHKPARLPRDRDPRERMPGHHADHGQAHHRSHLPHRATIAT